MSGARGLLGLVWASCMACEEFPAKMPFPEVGSGQEDCAPHQTGCAAQGGGVGF